MISAKLFKSGNSTAIRIPKSLMLDETKYFFIKKIGQSIVLTPIEDSCWSGVFDAIENFKGEIEREQPKLEERTFE